MADVFPPERILFFDLEQARRQKRQRSLEEQFYEQVTFICHRDRVLGLITACQTTSTGANTVSQKETLLVQAGFKWKTVTTPKQQERVSALPEGKVSAVKFKGRTYYVYPTATKDRILVGNQSQFNAYKQSLQAQRNQLTGPVFEEETHGPHPIQVQEFDGFGPLGK